MKWVYWQTDDFFGKYNQRLKWMAANKYGGCRQFLLEMMGHVKQHPPHIYEWYTKFLSDELECKEIRAQDLVEAYNLVINNRDQQYFAYYRMTANCFTARIDSMNLLLATRAFIDLQKSDKNPPNWESLLSCMCRDIFPWNHVWDHRIHQWMKANDGAVIKIAREIRCYNRTTLLPILADALEDAGCDDNQVLSHCRKETFHTRFCWVIQGIMNHGGASDRIYGESI